MADMILHLTQLSLVVKTLHVCITQLKLTQFYFILNKRLKGIFLIYVKKANLVQFV